MSANYQIVSNRRIDYLTILKKMSFVRPFQLPLEEVDDKDHSYGQIFLREPLFKWSFYKE